MEIYELLGVGIVLLLGILGGKISHRYKIPKVTGYMLIGLIFGPSVIGLLSQETLANISMINDIALGLILFAIGGEVEWDHLRSMGRKVIMIALGESFASFITIFFLTLLITGRPGLGILLGSISMATAPGVTLLVVREYRARGNMTDTMMSVIALNNILCLIVFRFAFAFYTYAHGAPVGEIALDLFKELIVSVIMGGAAAAIITFWEQKIDELSELLLVIIGVILLAIGGARTLGISHLMVCLIAGAVTNHYSMMHRLVYAELRQTEMPFYIAFFVLSGASLHLGYLAELGLLGLAYLVARPAAKYVGSYFMCRRFGATERMRQYFGLTLLPQAGVAIGLVLTVGEVFPEQGMIIGAVILSSVVVYEGIGPFLTRMSLAKTGEIYLQED